MAFPKMFLTLGFVVLALNIFPWSSQAKEPTDFSKKAFGKVLTILLRNQEPSFDERKIVARGFGVECGRLSEKIPELSPRENDWLDAELEAGRIRAILGTVEMAKRYAKRTLVACDNWARVISHVQPGELEVHYWANFLGAIADENLLGRLQILKQSNKIPLTDDDIGSVKYFFDMGLRIMINEILIPLTKPAS